MTEIRWRSFRDSWTDHLGRVWTRLKPRQLSAREARPFALRESTLVALESTDPDLAWLELPARREFWATRAESGHRFSRWRADTGELLLMITEEC
ncbi:hypothetical protein M8C13_05985 [Crossiella sp. SN42]|uniref:hypothetical protein n=1 Tax=Crossiella sp. SN42 TaxID=2944808 RepID=UPI00207CA53A|nr:hypothetical protein [Crossiella sp. SN42]MCO1575308.1 hypothetical protein [Crossiella sp. SN42]